LPKRAKQPPNLEWSRCNPDVLKAVAGTLKGWPLFFCGPAGSGKSALAALMYQTCPGWNDKILWVDFAAASRAIARSWLSEQPYLGIEDKAWVRADRMLADLGRSDKWRFVVVDDIGSRRPTDAQQDAALEIVKARIGMPTVYTSNLNLGELAQVYDDRLVDRLGAGEVIDFMGKSFRTGV